MDLGQDLPEDRGDMVTDIRHTEGFLAECPGEALAEAGEGGSPGADGIGKITGVPCVGGTPVSVFCR